MILATRTGNREHRDIFDNYDRIPRPSQFGGSWSTSGRRVSVNDAVGLPAVICALRLLSQTVGKLPVKVYRDNVEARTAPQWGLLHDKPNTHQTPFAFYSVVESSVDTYGNAYVLKHKSRGRVQELYPLDPCRVKVTVEDGEIRFEYREQDGGTVELTRDDVVHVVGPFVLPDNPYCGVSPIAAARDALGFALGLDEFGARFFNNDATPGVVIKTPQQLQPQQREELRESFESKHRGSANAHRAAVMWGGAEIERLSVSPVDAQWIEARQLSLEDVARVFGIPPGKLGIREAQGSEDPLKENRRFLEDALQPRFTCIEQALWADDDLFPDKALKPEFVADALLRADTIERYRAYLPAKQAGWITANEIRSLENMEPHPDGDELQQTPVGGAPNEPPPETPKEN